MNGSCCASAYELSLLSAKSRPAARATPRTWHVASWRPFSFLGLHGLTTLAGLRFDGRSGSRVVLSISLGQPGGTCPSAATRSSNFSNLITFDIITFDVRYWSLIGN